MVTFVFPILYLVLIHAKMMRKFVPNGLRYYLCDG